MSSGGIKRWFIFGELNAPPPPLLTPSAPAALAGLLDVRKFGAPPEPMPVRCGFASGASKGGGGRQHDRRRPRPFPPEDMEPDAKPHRTGCHPKPRTRRRLLALLTLAHPSLALSGCEDAIPVGIDFVEILGQMRFLRSFGA